MIWVEVITLSLIYIFVAYFAYFSNQSKLDKKHDYLHLSKAYLYLSIIGSAICLISGILILIFDHWTIAAVFFALSICFAFILTGYFGYRIYYDDEKLMYRKYYGSYKAIYYKDITHIDYIFDIEITSKDRKLVIPCYMANSNDFLETVLNNIPKKAKKKVKPTSKVRKLSDSIYRPVETIAGYVITGLCSAICVPLVFLGLKRQGSDGILFAIVFVGLGVIMCMFTIFGPISAKRAHSSKFWHSVAKLLHKDGYLKE